MSSRSVRTPRAARRTPLRVQILGAFAICLVLLGAAGIVSSLALRDLGARSYHAVNDTAQVETAMLTVSDVLWDVRLHGEQLQGLTGTPRAAAWSEQQHRYEVFEDAAASFAAQFQSRFGTPLDGVDEAMALWAQYRDAETALVTSARDTSVNGEQRAALGEELGFAVDGWSMRIAAAVEDRALDDQEAGRTAVTIVVALLVVGVAASLWAARHLSHRVVRAAIAVRSALEALAHGDLTVSADVSTRDEIGEMAASLGTAQAALRSTMAQVTSTADAVAAASESLASANAQVASGALTNSTVSTSLVDVAGSVSESVRSVAAGATQIGASIKEISHSAQEAARVASHATEVAQHTNAKVARLGSSSQEIGEVIRVISGIAEQTNLLALNATIEAARAGEAGRGFAVVAHEVKQLAQETARATDEVARRVGAIQGDTAEAVEAIDEISSIVAHINEFQSTIAAAVEEQTATTGHMAQQLEEAATGSANIAESVAVVAEGANDAAHVLGQMGASVSEMAHMSASLREEVGFFRYTTTGGSGGA